MLPLSVLREIWLAAITLFLCEISLNDSGLGRRIKLMCDRLSSSVRGRAPMNRPTTWPILIWWS
jgi:hypothetical protein